MPIRVLHVGLGPIGAAVVRQVSTRAGFKAVGAVDIDPAKLGRDPTTDTGQGLVDAFLWVKEPGTSDGTCRGGPAAGQWRPQYALELARNR